METMRRVQARRDERITFTTFLAHLLVLCIAVGFSHAKLKVSVVVKVYGGSLPYK